VNGKSKTKNKKTKQNKTKEQITERTRGDADWWKVGRNDDGCRDDLMARKSTFTMN